ncbi:MAG: SDR family oxidoreductase [Armatimonadetes bacterium]|nr:SDR family oxidoreductase [Armatimonadota bacterium]
MHVLISGGAGFVGSHLCDRFLFDGHRVTCVDNLLTGRAENIAALRSNSQFRFVEQDIAEFSVPAEKVDAVLHFASPASPPDYLRFPMETIRVGSLGTTRMLEIAHAHGARFVMASTSEIYGDPLVHPQREDYWGNVNPIGVRSVYDETKRFSEMLTAAWHRERGTNSAILRIFNTYGPRMRPQDGRLIPNFIAQALRGEDLTVYGDGSQTRSFCFFSDLVDGIVRLTLSDEHRPVNLGNPAEFTVLELAEMVKKLTGAASRLVFHPLPSDDPARRRPDIGRARALLGWEPKISLEDGLRETIAWFQREEGIL